MKMCIFKFKFIPYLLINFYCGFIFSAGSHYDVLPLAKEDYQYDQYFRINENSVAGFIDLLNLENIKRPFPLPSIPYNRREQFGTWIYPKNDNLCLNVRGLVLVRDADAAVTYSVDGCAVVSGAWDDPYTARTFASAREIQIDHFVPLKNAYMTGGYEWDANKRCLYANYLGNDFHLLAVNGTENMSKGDSSPAEYTPPNKHYVCQYLKQWLLVKVIWQLRLTPFETESIRDEVQKNDCARSDFQMTAEELSSQRRYMFENKNLCSRP